MRRVFWMAAGAVATAAGSRWTKRKARAAVDQYAPAEVGRRVARRAQAAKAEGRTAMAETEARLRAQLGARRLRRY